MSPKNIAINQLDFTHDEQEWLLNRYKGLSVFQENGFKIVSGDFSFTGINKGLKLSDTYQIRIELYPSIYSNLPRVIETGGRLKRISEERKIPLADLHTYPNGEACLCFNLDEVDYYVNGFSFPLFIEELVVPFFYSQKYFEENNNWPWEDYSHGFLGWLEWYFDHSPHSPESTYHFLLRFKTTHTMAPIIRELSKRNGVKGHHPCVCNSGIKYRECHPRVFRGIWELQKDIEKYEIPIR